MKTVKPTIAEWIHKNGIESMDRSTKKKLNLNRMDIMKLRECGKTTSMVSFATVHAIEAFIRHF